MELTYQGREGGRPKGAHPMPWVGVGYMTLQENYTITGPGGASLYRILMKCSCGSSMEFSIAPADRARDLAVAMGRIVEHWTEHLHIKG